jgi:hypothetical protein
MIQPRIDFLPSGAELRDVTPAIWKFSPVGIGEGADE